MGAREEFDEWATAGKDRGMAERHWQTAKHALASMPIEPGEDVLDVGCGSGYALRALADSHRLGRAVGLDGAPEMVRNARTYTESDRISYVLGEFGALPFADGVFDHVWSMEALYYARDPVDALTAVRRVLRPGGTFFCAVNFFEESEQTHEWRDRIDAAMTLWSQSSYREGFREAGFHVATQETIPDREIDIPPADAFPIEDWDSREAMVDRYRQWGTLLTVGVTPT